MASRGDSPTLFAGQPWSAYYESVAGSRGEEAKDASDQPEAEAASDGGSMKLRRDDIKIFGVCPSLDEFYLTVCDHCGAVIKPQALMGHIEVRHKGSNNDFKPLEHLATNKEPLLKQPHKNKAKLSEKASDKVTQQNPMAKYGLPKAPPNYHPNGKPKSALVEQLNKAHAAPLIKTTCGSSSTGSSSTSSSTSSTSTSSSGGGSSTAPAPAATIQLAAASRKLLQPPLPVPSPLVASSTSLLPPPPPQPPPPPEQRPEPPASQASASKQPQQQQLPASSAGHGSGSSVVPAPSHRDEARHQLREPALPRVGAATGSSALTQPAASISAGAVVAVAAPLAATPPLTTTVVGLASFLEPSSLSTAASSRCGTSPALAVPSDSSKSVGDVRPGPSYSVTSKLREGGGPACPPVMVGPSVGGGSRGNTGSAAPGNCAMESAKCAAVNARIQTLSSRPAAEPTVTAVGKVTELAAVDDSRRSTAPEAAYGLSVCSVADDSRGCKRSPGSLSPPPFKKPCRLGGTSGSSSALRLLPCKDREYDPDKHCGVFVDDVHRNCTRSLTCKTHALSLRRKVPGRTKPFDQLLKEHREAKEAALQSKLKGSSPPPPLHSGRVFRTSPALSFSSHSPRSTTGSCDLTLPDAASARLSVGADSGSSCAGLPLYRQPSLPEGYLTHHPRPLAVNSFGVRLNGCTFVLNRKADLLRTAVQATLDQRQLHLLHPARKQHNHTKGAGSTARDSSSAPGAPSVVGTAATAAATADGSPAISRTSTNLTSSVLGMPVPVSSTIVGGKATMLSPAFRSAAVSPFGGAGGLAGGVSLSYSSAAAAAAAMAAASSLDGSAAKRHKSGDSPAVASTIVTVPNALHSLQGSAQQAGQTATQQLLGAGGSTVSLAGGIQASRPLLATLAARQQQQQLLQQQQKQHQDSGSSGAAQSAAPAMTATLLALGATSTAGGLVRFGSQSVPQTIGSLGSLGGAATGKGVASGVAAGAATTVLVTDIPVSVVDKGGGSAAGAAVSTVGSSPTTFLLTSCGTAENARLKGSLVNGSIQMTTNTSSIGALTSRTTSAPAPVASTLLASLPSNIDGSTTFGTSLSSTCGPNALFRKPETVNALTTNSTVGVGASLMSGSSVTGVQLSAVAGQRHLSMSSASASQSGATIGALLGSGSTLMAGQHIIQQQQPAMSIGGYPLHISSSSLKSLPQHSIRLVNASQPHQTLRQQLSPAVSLTIPLVASSPQQPQSQQQQPQQSAVHKAAAAQSGMSNLRV